LKKLASPDFESDVGDLEVASLDKRYIKLREFGAIEETIGDIDVSKLKMTYRNLMNLAKIKNLLVGSDDKCIPSKKRKYLYYPFAFDDRMTGSKSVSQMLRKHKEIFHCAQLNGITDVGCKKKLVRRSKKVILKGNFDCGDKIISEVIDNYENLKKIANLDVGWDNKTIPRYQPSESVYFSENTNGELISEVNNSYEQLLDIAMNANVGANKEFVNEKLFTQDFTNDVGALQQPQLYNRFNKLRPS